MKYNSAFVIGADINIYNMLQHLLSICVGCKCSSVSCHLCKHIVVGSYFETLQNLLWLVKIYHPHLAQFRDNANFTISDLQNNTKMPNLMNN